MIKITIKEIAKELGVSTQAISCALNDKPNISKELKKKVNSKAKEMGYEKNHIASSLKTKKTKTIGLFILGRSIETRQRVLNGIISEARKYEYDIVLFTMGSELDTSKSYARLCKQRMVEGVIFTGIRMDDPHIDEIKKLDIPVVVMDTDLGGDTNSVTMDHRLAIKKVVNHLKSLGHERIALVNGHKAAQITEDIERYYKREVNKNFHMLGYSDFDEKSAYKATSKIMEGKLKPTAIIAINNLVAMGIMNCLKDANIKIPEDLSLVQLNDITLSKHLTPPLTSIYQNDFIRGQKSVELIIEKKKRQIIIVEPVLNIRESSKKVKSADKVGLSHILCNPPN